MRSRVIGGEFELSAVPEGRALRSPECSRYSSGRAALYHILRSLRPRRLWLPDWLCETMIDAARKAGVGIAFYALGKDLRMDMDRFPGAAPEEAIVLVNYFGLVDIDGTVRELKSRGVEAALIEDDVQALFSFLDGSSHGADYRFTSLRKSIAAPDGALVRADRPMPKVDGTNSFAPLKLQGALLKGAAAGDAAYLRCFEEGERLMDENYDSRMSEEAEVIFAATDLGEAAVRRQRNARYLVERLSRMGIEPLLSLAPQRVPLFVPIAVPDRDGLRRALRQQGIYCPVHWPLREDMGELEMGRYMAENELSLVIDQRYEAEDMQSLADTMEAWICK